MSKVYEVNMPEFEFYKNNEPTGHYARGIAINEDEGRLELELLCNGHKVWVPRSVLKLISEDNHSLGHNYREPYIEKF